MHTYTLSDLMMVSECFWNCSAARRQECVSSQYLHFCTSKASKLSTWRAAAGMCAIRCIASSAR